MHESSSVCICGAKAEYGLMAGQFDDDNAKCHNAENNADICEHPVFFLHAVNGQYDAFNEKNDAKNDKPHANKGSFRRHNSSVAYLEEPGCGNIKKAGQQMRPALVFIAYQPI